jgi:hypothetical protein
MSKEFQGPCTRSGERERAHRAAEKEERLRKRRKRDKERRAAETQEQRGKATLYSFWTELKKFKHQGSISMSRKNSNKSKLLLLANDHG